MKRFLLATIVCLGAISCSNNKSAVIDLDLKGAPGKEVVLSKLNINQIKVLDTVKTNNNGKVSIKVTPEDGSPNFYYLSYGRKKLASLILQPGEKVSVSSAGVIVCKVPIAFLRFNLLTNLIER